MARKTITLKYGIQMKEPRRLPPWLKMLLTIAVIVLAVFSAYKFVIWVLAPSDDQPIEISITFYVPTTPEPTEQPTPTVRPSPTIRLDALNELSDMYYANEYVRGWVYIPGVGLDCVILQFQNNYFFLDHDLSGNPNEYGAVFFDYRNDLSFMEEAGHIIVYGHNQTGGRQLSRLSRYLKEDYFKNNNLIIIDTMYGTYNFRVFSVHITDDDTPYLMTADEKDTSTLIEECMNASKFISSNLPGEDSVILTFSTDIEDLYGNRLLIHAYLDN